MVSAKHARAWALKAGGDIKRGDTGLGAHLGPLVWDEVNKVWSVPMLTFLPFDTTRQRELMAWRLDLGRGSVPPNWRPNSES